MKKLIRPIMLVGVIIAFAWISNPTDGRLHIFFFDTKGDAVLIQTPKGRYVLIDGGADPSNLALALGKWIPFWMRTLEGVILTRNDEAHIPGQVAAVLRYRATLAFAPQRWRMADDRWRTLTEALRKTSSSLPETLSVSSDDPMMDEWLRSLLKQQTPVYALRRNMRLSLDGAILTVLATGDAAQEPSPVLMLTYGNNRILFIGSCASLEDNDVLRFTQRVTVLVYPWVCEMDESLFALWKPQAIVFTTGEKKNKPTLLTYAERQKYSKAIYHKNMNGTVELICEHSLSGNRGCMIRTERGIK